MANNDRELTSKEQKVVEGYEAARPGLGKIAEQNIRNDSSGWKETIEDTPEEELVVKEGTAHNSFMYKRLG